MDNIVSGSKKPAGHTQGSAKQFILIAEDDTFYARVYQFKLTKEGFEVQVAHNGEEALEMARRRKPNLILLDIIMPVKDGFATLAELKADPLLKDVRVVVFSSLGQEEDKRKAMALGATDYFVKSNISVSEMVKKVKELVQ